MNYFDWIRLTKRKDNRESFIKYLVEIMDYTEDVAIEESKIYYR